MARWTHFNQNEGTGNAEIEVTAEPNTQFKYRTGSIAAFGSKGKVATIPIMQKPGIFYGMFSKYTTPPTSLPFTITSSIADQFNISTDLVPELVKFHSYGNIYRCIVIALYGFPISVTHVATGPYSVVTQEEPVTFTYDGHKYTVHTITVNCADSVDTINVTSTNSNEPLVNFVFYRS